MNIVEFNGLSVSDAGSVVRACAAIDEWVDDVVRARPFASLEELVTFADKTATLWTPAQVDAALADHPRIGDKHEGSGVSAQMSGSEQSRVDPADSVVAQRLAEGNQKYEDTFDRIFLIRAAGRDAQEILDELDRRLDNDPETELTVVASELRQIAVLRLKGLFS